MASAVLAEHTRVIGARGYVFSDKDAAIRRLRRAAAGSLVGHLAFLWKWVAVGLGPLLPFWIPSHGKRFAGLLGGCSAGRAGCEKLEL